MNETRLSGSKVFRGTAAEIERILVSLGEPQSSVRLLFSANQPEIGNYVVRASGFVSFDLSEITGLIGNRRDFVKVRLSDMYESIRDMAAKRLEELWAVHADNSVGSCEELQKERDALYDRLSKEQAAHVKTKDRLRDVEQKYGLQAIALGCLRDAGFWTRVKWVFTGVQAQDEQDTTTEDRRG